MAATRASVGSAERKAPAPHGSATGLSPARATRAPQSSPEEGLYGEGVLKGQAPASPMLKLFFVSEPDSILSYWSE